MDRLWQPDLLQHLTTWLKPNQDVLALIVFGSAQQLETQIDYWSDLDLLLVVKNAGLVRFFPTTDWLQPIGPIFATSQSSDPAKSTTRVCFEDFRRVDFVITTPGNLLTLPVYQKGQLIFSRSDAVDQYLAQPHSVPTTMLASDEQVAEIIDQFWFKAMLAVQKVMRNDRLIALHLALDLIRDCCLLGMILRDRAEGTTHHRTGGIGNTIVDKIQTTQQPYTATGILQMVEQSSIEFDQLATQWSQSYQNKRQPLLKWIAVARQSLADRY